MPKKRNFLGGMQNYNAQTGEYEPALKGPNGESPSGFKSFKKQEEKDESFDTVNKKRMGIDKEINKWQEENPEGKVLKGKSAKEIGENAENGTFKLDKEKYPDVEETPYGFIYNVNGESITDLKAQNKKFGMSGGSGFLLTKDGDEVYFETFEDAYKAAKGESGNNDFTSEDYVDDFYDRVSDLQKEVNTSGIDDDEYDAEINKLKEELETKKDSMSEDDYNKAKEMLDRFSRPKDDSDSSFDRFNAKRIGKEDKSHKSAERKDKYGNPLLSDDAFKVGQKAAKEYLEESLKYNDLDSLKKSNMFLGYMQDKISDALEQAGLNPDYDLTYQDLNEIIGSVIGEEIDFEDYEGNATKGWTGKKYSGYIPQENKKPKLPF